MDAQLNKKLRLFLTLLGFISAGFLLLHTMKISQELLLLLGLYHLLAVSRDYILKIDLAKTAGLLFLYAQLGLAFMISLLSEDFFAQIYILILIGEFTLHRSRMHAIIFTSLSYASWVLSLMIYLQFPPFERIYYLIPRVVEYLGIFGISVLAKIAFQQKNQLAEDNEKLRVASIELVRKARLQERTRISRDIHDSVGHTLTSALTGLQTAAHAIGKSNYAVAQEMIDRTKANILSSLDDVRSSVHLLRENLPSHPFIPELVKLIEETKKQTSVEVSSEIDPGLPEDLTPLIELTIFRALQEGLTNGIRHGASTSFRFKLTRHADHIRFILSDNGTRPAPIIRGFGLNAMKERVEDVGGQLSIIAKEATEGVTLDISIPWPPHNNRPE